MGMGRNVLLLLAAAALMSAAGNIYSSVMPDFLHNVLGIGGDVRGALELPRELPGFLQVFLITLLAGAGRIRSTALSFAAGVVSFAALALFGSSLAVFIATMILWSAGMHVFVPLRDALALELAPGDRRGVILGNVGASRSLGLILGSACIWIIIDRLGMGYGGAFAAGAVILAAGGLVCIRIEAPGSVRRSPDPPRRLVMRRRYWLYYVLAILFGARKQIFLTFAPWLLVSSYGQTASGLALAMGVSAGLGLFSKPLFGSLIDRYGERTVLTWESILVTLMCLGYAFAPLALAPVAAVFLLYALYILDELLFSLAMARTTYLSRIVASDDELVPTLGMGGTLDHAVSMTVPVGAGLLWACVGPWSVFVMAAGVAIANLFFVRKMEVFTPERSTNGAAF
jgi:predicted MFS family arabinose efflux permease